MPLTKQLRSPFAPSRTRAADAERLAAILHALASPVRLRILGLIRSYGEAAVAVDLAAPLGLSRPTVSHHLAVLVGSGLVEAERRGKHIHLRVVTDKLGEVAGALTP